MVGPEMANWERQHLSVIAGLVPAIHPVTSLLDERQLEWTPGTSPGVTKVRLVMTKVGPEWRMVSEMAKEV